MIVIKEKDANNKIWRNALVSFQLDQFRAYVNRFENIERLDSGNKDRQYVLLAEFLCEMSRDIVYRLNRVTVSDLQEIVGAFSEMIERFTSCLPEDPTDRNLVNAYLSHVQTRIDLLKAEIEL
ncbi:MAG: hypothetical protein WBD20_05910 [Pirellulaceae bacterium]